ncbi:MAG: hypothetical protein Q8P49_03920 [Candidatus Liptonbacteria bacterium]|nr:hypothetical protein [Candidatus Liptonbacteria bacterium]
MIKKSKLILPNTLPLIIMIALIPIVQNDYLLTGIYCAIITIFLNIRREPGDITVFFFGFFIMAVSEYFFIGTGVETFTRNSLFGIMPLWLPFLWGYGFVAIKRSVKVLGS